MAKTKAKKSKSKEEPQSPQDAAMAAVLKKYGQGSLLRMTGSADAWPSTSTGSIGLDRALGIGGLPHGRIVEIFGQESSGKTTLTLHLIAEAQRAGRACVFVDAEHALDPTYAAALGVDMDELMVSQPDYGEQALDIVDTLVESGAFGVVVVDSVAALTPKAELDGEIGDSHVGRQARLMGQALRKICANANKTGTMVVFINQMRMKIGVTYGSPLTTPGGNALKFYASVRLDIRRIAKVKSGEEVVANRTKVTVVKNKMAPPFKETEFQIRFGIGIDTTDELLDEAKDVGLITNNGAHWYYTEDPRLGDLAGTKISQGRDRVLAVWREHPEQVDLLRGLVL